MSLHLKLCRVQYLPIKEKCNAFIYFAIFCNIYYLNIAFFMLLQYLINCNSLYAICNTNYCILYDMQYIIVSII